MFRAAIGLLKRHQSLIVLLCLFTVVAYFPLFLHLGSDTVHAWDESMFAMRAYQLANEGTFLENFGVYTAGFDNPNIKPPFGTYFQAIGLKIFGYKELGLRLPIALFCLATGLLIIWFFYRYFNNPLLGFVAALLLICSPGYTAPHIARTGDHEGILVFLVLAGLFSLYRFIDTGIPKWCYTAAVMFALGFLTKNLVAFFPMPAVLLYVVYHGKLVPLVSSKTVWKGIMLFAAILAVQYAIVWYLSPYNFRFLGFANVQDRFVNTVQGHAAPMGYYWNNVVERNFLPWIYLIPVSLILLTLNRFKPYRNIILLLAGATACHLIVISLSKTKLPWYDASVYPWLAIIAAFTVWACIDWVNSRWKLATIASTTVTTLFLIAVFGFSYVREVKENLVHPITAPQQQVGSLLKKVRDDNPALNSFTLIDNDHDGNLVASFYINSMNDHMGFNIKYQDDFENIKVGDTIGFCSTGAIQYFDSLFTQQSQVYTNGCKVVVLQDTIKTNHTTPH